MNVFELAAKLTLDKSEYEKGLVTAGEKMSSFGATVTKGIGSIASGAMKASVTALKAGMTAVTAGAGVVTAFAKQAMDAYADYEQLIGGVETLFGDASGKVMQYANEAYKTAGLSANEYMETVTAFSASLLQSLDNDSAKAAEVADMAIRDMADNANKMGTSMESIQTAYQGFAKQNYTMLDNLKLGYGGTKSEMQRLLKDAQKLTGVKYDINNLNDVYEAIHAVQEEMGITGTTAAEASETIAGSTAAMKSAWQNLIAGIGDENSNLEELVNNFVESAGTALENTLPRFKIILEGMGSLIETLVPIIMDKIPGFLADELPKVFETGKDLVSKIAGGITENLPTLLTSAGDIITTLASDITDGLAEGSEGAGKVLEAAAVFLNTIVTNIGDNLSILVPTAFDMIGKIVDTLMQEDVLGNLLDAATEILTSLADYLADPDTQESMAEKIPEVIGYIVGNLIEHAPDMIEAAVEIVGAIGEGIVNSAANVVQDIADFVTSIINYLSGHDSEFEAKGAEWAQKLMEGFKKAISALGMTAGLGDLSANVNPNGPGGLGNMNINDISAALNSGDTYTAGRIAGTKSNVASPIVQGSNVVQNWNINVTGSNNFSPDEMFNAVRTESKYGLLGYN